jgi:hypothetical protein
LVGATLVLGNRPAHTAREPNPHRRPFRETAEYDAWQKKRAEEAAKIKSKSSRAALSCQQSGL